MYQQKAYGQGSTQGGYSQQSSFSLNQPQGQVGLNQPQGQFALNQPQGQFALNQPQGQFGLNQPQGQIALNQPQGQFGLNQPQGQFGLNQPQGQIGLNQPQGQFGLNQPQGQIGLNQPQGQPSFDAKSNYNNGGFGQGQGQFNVNVGQEGSNLGQQGPPPEQQPTSSADIALYMKKKPYTQFLAGEEFTFSVLPKKQSTFFMSHERLLMMKGCDLLCYAREFPAGKQLPFLSLADVPAPKASYPLAQVEKCEVADDKLTIRFAGPTKVAWEFVCPTKNCAIEWAQKIDAAKATAVRNGMQTNFQFKYQEDMGSGYDSPEKRGSESPRQQGSPQQGQFNANIGYNQPQYGSTNQQYSPSTYQQQSFSPSKHDFNLNRDYSLSTNSNVNLQGNSYNTGYPGNGGVNVTSSNLANTAPVIGSNYASNSGVNYAISSNTNNYSRDNNLGSQGYNVSLGQQQQNYQTGTPDRQQFSVGVNQQQPNYASNSNYRQGTYEVRDNKPSISTQGQSTISNSSINSQGNVPRYQAPGPIQTNYEPPRHF